MKFCKDRGSKREQRSGRWAVGTISTKTAMKDMKEDRAIPEHSRKLWGPSETKVRKESPQETRREKLWGRRGGKRVKWTFPKAHGEKTERKEEFLAIWSWNTLKGLKYSKQLHLGASPMPLCPWSRSSISAEAQVLPCLSYAVGELILSSVSGTNLRLPLQAACLQSCLCHHLLPLDLLGGPGPDSPPHLLWDNWWATVTGI